MKRSVAILGPTPQFVRWAIRLPCPLRELEGKSLPDQTFRQLRGLREYSIAVSEHRLFEKICVHPAASASDIEQCRGFIEDEVLAPQGGLETIAQCCRDCPANAVGLSRPGVWAGCYGWFPAQSGFSFESRSLKKADPELNHPRIDFVDVLEESVLDLNIAKTMDSLFRKTTPRWYGIWQHAVFGFESSSVGNPYLGTLLQVFQRMVSRCRSLESESNLENLIQFRDALAVCVEHRLALHVELVPPGNSDGQTWTLSAHCPECKNSLPEITTQQRCSACGRFGNPHGQQKCKVLGLRPYVQLVGVMGTEKAAEFMQRYESQARKV